MKQSLRALLLATVLLNPILRAQEKNGKPSAEEINKKIAAMMPKDPDFKFTAPRGWGENLMKLATVESVSVGECAEKAKLIIDGQPATRWTSSNYRPSPEDSMSVTDTRDAQR